MPIIGSYPHGEGTLAAKLAREASEAFAARYYVTHDGSGRPGYIAIRLVETAGGPHSAGCRSTIPYGGHARDVERCAQCAAENRADIPVWTGHVSVLPAIYRNATDPYGRLTRPDSSD